MTQNTQNLYKRVPETKLEVTEICFILHLWITKGLPI